MFDLFISDLHIGSSLFNREEELKIVLGNKYNQRFLLGDIIDTYEFPWQVTCEKYKDLISYINELHPIIIRGNHDPNIKDLCEIFPDCSVFEEYMIKIINSKKTIIMHGDRYNYTCKAYHLIAKYLKNKTWRTYLHKLYSKNNYAQFEKQILAWDEQRTIACLKNKFERIIMGHTHTPKIVKTPHITYINTGCWIYKPSFIEYDYESRNFKLIWV